MPRTIYVRKRLGHVATLSLVALVATLAITSPALAQSQTNDTQYAEKIKEYTTDERYLNEMVDHLPYSADVPSPLEHFGTIVGAPGILHRTKEIHAYLRSLAEASPRVMVRAIGSSEEDREMIEVIVADEATLARLDDYRAFLNRLADPRMLSDEEAAEIVAEAKPIYYITCGLHSPETGSPEMIMEMAYRLAVEDGPLFEAIRNNVILIFVPVTEPDGRDRMVDIYNYRKDHNDVGPGLLYWGHYVAHDNNRDGFGLGLALTRNVLASFLHWKPTVLHDLHESVPYLYTSTGTGPYNEYIDPITIDEWHNLAHAEVSALTRRGMPGVWTHGFYTGWAANYLMWVANTRNAIGRFYETFGNSVADTLERKLPSRSTSRKWYRPNPPLEKTMWSLRNNTNYMQSGVLVALKYTADHRAELVDNFYLKTKKAVERGRSEAPYAYVIPRPQKRLDATINLIKLLQQQGIEVHEAAEELTWLLEPPKDEDEQSDEKGADAEETAESSKQEAESTAESDADDVPTQNNTDSPDKESDEPPKTHTAPAGSYVIHMDQPYRTLVQVLLGKQTFPKDATPPYDDTGWTLPLLHQVESIAVDDPAIREAPLVVASLPGAIEIPAGGEDVACYLVDNTTDDHVALVRFKLVDVKMLAAEAAFEKEGHKWHAGTLIIPTEGNPADLAAQLTNAVGDHQLMVRSAEQLPEVSTHEVELPRVGFVHTWVSTPQDAGWWRMRFDDIGLPYTYLSEQDLATEDLGQFDVLVMPRTRANPQTLVSGSTRAGEPIPWEPNDKYPALGHIDQTDDVRRGMGYEGVARLKEFIEAGGVFITEGSTAAFPIDMAITRRVSVRRTSSLVARGTVLAAQVEDIQSPITYGYDKKLAVYFNQAPVFRVNKYLGRASTPDWLKDEIWEKEVPRTVLSFAKKDLLLSGMLRGENELAGTPAVLDVPVGNGHVVLLAIRPFWRMQTPGSHALVLNTMLHWNDLRVGWPERPEEDPPFPTVAGGHEEHEQFETFE